MGELRTVGYPFYFIESVFSSFVSPMSEKRKKKKIENKQWNIIKPFKTKILFKDNTGNENKNCFK